MSEEKKNRSQYIPIILIWFDIILFFFIDFQEYADIYYKFVAFIDTFLFVLSILYYFSDGSKWGFTAKKSLLTAISLNILNEFSYIVDMPNYFTYYVVIVSLYFASLAIEAYNYYKDTQK